MAAAFDIKHNQASSLFDESPITLTSGKKAIGGITNAPKSSLNQTLLISAVVAVAAVLAYKKIKRV